MRALRGGAGVPRVRRLLPRADARTCTPTCAATWGTSGPRWSSLTRTPEDGRIGAVRGDLEKLDPTFGNVSRSGLVPEPVLQPLLQAHVGYRDEIWELGDDETYRAVPPGVRAMAE